MASDAIVAAIIANPTAARVRGRFDILRQNSGFVTMSPFSLTCRWLAIALPSILLSSCAYIERTETPKISTVTLQAISDANAHPLKIRRVLQSRRMALDTLPVGSIVPFYNASSLAIPENWRFCNGDVVNDPRSPLNGTRLPNLIDDRFLAGSASGYGEEGGSNTLTADGEHNHDALSSRAGIHSHGGTTGVSQNNGRVRELEAEGEIRVRLVDQAHRHAITPDGGHVHAITVQPAGIHDHGGDRRPEWFGVLYIIKIK
jgi:hypothetical protein